MEDNFVDMPQTDEVSLYSCFDLFGRLFTSDIPDMTGEGEEFDFDDLSF